MSQVPGTPLAPGPSLTVHDDLPHEAWRVVDTGLGEANEAAAPLHEVRPLSAFARLASGEVIGGAIGRTWGDCCELQQLWVSPAYRRQGIGGRIVRAFEERAQERGCHTYYLETFSFQAPSLYRSLGYEVRLELQGFSPGVAKYVMVRQAGVNIRPAEPRMTALLSATPQHLQERLAGLARELARRDDALALLALGSTGRDTDRLDAWSDLDFFVLVRDGAKRGYIDRLDWLAATHPLAWHFQNTADGHKVLMADGVFCEFAVFEMHELSRIPYAPGRFVWRRDEVDEALACPTQPLPSPHGAPWLVGEALSNLIVGLQRHARGEKLAAMRMVQVQALDRVLEFLETLQPAAHEAHARRDPFNVDRRIEARNPQAAAALPTWAGGYTGTVPAALALLACLEAHGVVPAVVSERIAALADSAR